MDCPLCHKPSPYYADQCPCGYDFSQSNGGGIPEVAPPDWGSGSENEPKSRTRSIVISLLSMATLIVLFIIGRDIYYQYEFKSFHKDTAHIQERLDKFFSHLAGQGSGTKLTNMTSKQLLNTIPVAISSIKYQKDLTYDERKGKLVTVINAILECYKTMISQIKNEETSAIRERDLQDARPSDTDSEYARARDSLNNPTNGTLFILESVRRGVPQDEAQRTLNTMRQNAEELSRTRYRDYEPLIREYHNTVNELTRQENEIKLIYNELHDLK